MENPYREVLREKLIKLLSDRSSPATIDEVVELLEEEFIGSYLYQIVWTDQVPTKLKPVFCDYFRKTGVDTYIAMREGKYVTALCNHQFLDCRIEVHRERQLNELLENE